MAKKFEIKELLPVSQWAEKRFVGRDESARAGYWDNSITPFAVEPMNAFMDPEVEHETFQGSSQVVKTEIIKNILGYIVDNDLGPSLIIYPSEGDARDFSTEKLEPMIRNNSFLSEKVAPEKHGSKDNKTLFKKTKSGHFIAIAGGRVPQDLARRSVKYVIADDRSRIGTAGNEGDAVSLAWQRTESYTFLGRKLLEFSSPTYEGICPTEASYFQSDQREYYMPCPHCGHMQTFKFENLVWEKEESDLFGMKPRHLPETVKLKCENNQCNQLIEERFKMFMLTNGTWIPKYPERKKHRGYKINRLYSTFSSWQNIVELFLDSKDDPAKLQVFYNTVLAKTWKLEEVEQIDETGLLQRCEDYLTQENPGVPNEVVLLTCFVDVQADRLEVQVEGWGVGEENWLIYYDQLWGDPDQKDVWDQLDEILGKTWKRKDGVELKLGGTLNGRRYYATFIDSGGKNTQSVYEYTRLRQHRGIISTKGRANQVGLPVLINRSMVGKLKDTVLYNLGVDTIKEIIWKRLKNGYESGKFIGGSKSCHFTTQYCDVDYFKMLLAERPYKGYDRSLGVKIIWKKEKQGARNEPWDLKVGNYAAFKSCAANLERLKEEYAEQALKVSETKEEEAAVRTEPKPPVKTMKMQKHNFVNSWR